jgi:Secretion system C-terminal sorting domain
MKLKTTLLLTLLSLGAFAQSKSTGTLTFVPGLSASITLNSATSIATLVLSGPSDRWIACKFGSFTTGMQATPDVVYYNGTALVDATQTGGGPSDDTTQNWTVSSNTVSGSTRTITATRNFTTGDSSDFAFVFANTTIDIAAAFGPTPNSFALEYHGAGNRNKFIDTPLTSALALDKFSLNNAQLYPNPSNGDFNIKSETSITKVNVYTQTGAFVKTVEVENNVDNATINIKGLSTGVYLIELVNDTEKSWKKIIVN